MKKWLIQKWNYIIWKIRIKYFSLETKMRLEFMKDHDLIPEQDYKELEANRQEILRKAKILGG